MCKGKRRPLRGSHPHSEDTPLDEPARTGGSIYPAYHSPALLTLGSCGQGQERSLPCGLLGKDLCWGQLARVSAPRSGIHTPLARWLLCPRWLMRVERQQYSDQRGHQRPLAGLQPSRSSWALVRGEGLDGLVCCREACRQLPLLLGHLPGALHSWAQGARSPQPHQCCSEPPRGRPGCV